MGGPPLVAQSHKTLLEWARSESVDVAERLTAICSEGHVGYMGAGLGLDFVRGAIGSTGRVSREPPAARSFPGDRRCTPPAEIGGLSRRSRATVSG